MSQPSHSFLMVEIVALLLRPLTILLLLTIDCVTPLILHSLLMEISRSRHNSAILPLTASPSFITVRLQAKAKFYKSESQFQLGMPRQ